MFNMWKYSAQCHTRTYFSNKRLHLSEAQSLDCVSAGAKADKSSYVGVRGGGSQEMSFQFPHTAIMLFPFCSFITPLIDTLN